MYTPNSVFDALLLYRNYLNDSESAKRADQIYYQTMTAIYRYTLPGWGHSAPTGRKPTKVESASAEDFLKNTPVKKLKTALDDQQKVFDAISAKGTQQSSYRFRLKKFVNWVQRQGWLSDSEAKKKKNLAPRILLGQGRAGDKRVTNRILLPAYTLKPEDVSPQALDQINKFEEFMGDDFQPKKLKPAVIKQRIASTYRIFGWFCSTQGIDKDEIRLTHLIPKVSIMGAENKNEVQAKLKEAANYVDTWIRQYLGFLKTERKNNSSSLSTAILPLIQLTKYQYADEVEDYDYSDIPILKKIRYRLNTLIQKSKTEDATADESMKWLDLPDVITKIVEPLRHETNYKLAGGFPRGISAIADSFQDFISWGLMIFLPPRRQQEWRDCRISLSCNWRKKPKGIGNDQFIHPLPENEDRNKYHGYLYKDIDGKWYKDTPPESYKTGKTYGHQKIEIPNRVFKDGKCFYDYLEAFIYGYYRDKEGNWLSGGQLEHDVLAKHGAWHGLRMAFNPNHDYLFVKPMVGKAHESASFSRMFKSTAHRLTGQLLTPHLLRDIYATWFLTNRNGSEDIASLAYAMAHSEEMLRKIYDSRTPDQKSRAAVEAIASILDEIELKKSLERPTVSAKVILNMLTPEQKDILISKLTPKLIIPILTPEQKRKLTPEQKKYLEID